MALSFSKRLWALALAALCLSIFCCKIGKASEDAPETGFGGYGEGRGSEDEPYTHSGESEDEPYTHSGESDHGERSEDFPETGNGAHDPAEIVSKALLCFNDKYIYKTCEESYRLSVSGNLHVPPEYTDQFCEGPCLRETHLVLDCIDSILTHFVFYNKATVWDVKDTIKAGCGHGLERGHFDVAEHLQAEEDSAHRTVIGVLFGLAMMFSGILMFF